VIDVTLASLTQDSSDVSCMLTVESGTMGLMSNSDFKCHINFDDEESEIEAGRGGQGCNSEATPDTGLFDLYRLGENGVCTTSDLTVAYWTSKGKKRKKKKQREGCAS
jgi:hypothetical protein